MVRRNSFALVLAFALSIAGCAVADDASDIDEEFDSTESAIAGCTDNTDGPCEDEDTAPKANLATLVAWVPSTGSLTYSVAGVSRTVRILSSTRVRRAPVNRYLPTDPVRPLIVRWNSLVTSGRTTFGQTNTD